MKRTKPLLALVLAAVIALSLAGCGTLMTDSVGALVQGNLDELYLGQYNEDFLQLVDITEAEAEPRTIWTGLTWRRSFSPSISSLRT